MKLNIDLDNNILKFLKIKEDTSEEKIKERIYNILKIALREEGLNVDEIFVCIQSVKEDEIRSINKEYRNVDRVTDVLSFPIFSRDELIKISKDENIKKIKQINLGDIIVCLDKVKEQSIEYNTGVEREMLYMITHGICHLLGHDHEEESDKAKMRSLEELILNEIGVGRDG